MALIEDLVEYKSLYFARNENIDYGIKIADEKSATINIRYTRIETIIIDGTHELLEKYGPIFQPVGLNFLAKLFMKWLPSLKYLDFDTENYVGVMILEYGNIHPSWYLVQMSAFLQLFADCKTTNTLKIVYNGRYNQTGLRCFLSYYGFAFYHVFHYDIPKNMRAEFGEMARTIHPVWLDTMARKNMHILCQSCNVCDNLLHTIWQYLLTRFSYFVKISSDLRLL